MEPSCGLFRDGGGYSGLVYICHAVGIFCLFFGAEAFVVSLSLLLWVLPFSTTSPVFPSSFLHFFFQFDCRLDAVCATQYLSIYC